MKPIFLGFADTLKTFVKLKKLSNACESTSDMTLPATTKEEIQRPY